MTAAGKLNLIPSELASGGAKSHVPYGKLVDNQREFIDPKYCPRRFIFKDPRNMTKSDIIQFCEHVKQRQEEHGVEEAFRFLKYWNGKEMIAVAYGTSASDERAAERARKQREARAGGKRSNKKKGKRAAANQAEVDLQAPANQATVAAADPSQVSPQRLTQDPADIMQIDPILLAVTGHGDNDPSSSTAAMRAPELSAEGMIINEEDMQLLRPLGYGGVLPVNGPNEGPPVYHIPAAAVNVLTQQKMMGNQPAHHAPSEATQKLRVPRKRMGNADTQTLQEGQALLASSRTTRSRSKRGRQKRERV